MSWLTNFVRPKIRALVKKPETPDNLWDKCPACGQMIFHRELEANQRVCTHCGHHLRIGVKRLDKDAATPSCQSETDKSSRILNAQQSGLNADASG